MWTSLKSGLAERFRAVGGLVRTHPWRVLIAALGVLTAGLLLVPYDLRLHYAIWLHQPEPWPDIAEFFRDWGNFTDTIVICGALGLFGKLRNKPGWRRAALTTFLAACCAGLTSNVFRFGVGRERPPREEIHTEFRPFIAHGPTTEYKHQSFPSGHSTTSMACGTALTTCMPKFGWLGLINGIMIVWSSLYDGVHYASDCLIGAGFGTIFGILFGIAHRQLYDGKGNRR